MKILVVKTSSMGDVIHTLPALTDALRALSDLQIDWVVEEAFSEIPSWHPGCRRVISIALRRWGKHPIKALSSGEWKQFRSEIRRSSYDKIIDAQGLFKSACIARMADGVRYGLDRSSLKEPLAAWAYHQKFFVPKQAHAIQRTRQLFALSLGYPLPQSDPDWGLDKQKFQNHSKHDPYVVFLHGASQRKKTQQGEFWRQLVRCVQADGLVVYLPWGTASEKERAEQIAGGDAKIRVLPHMSLTELSRILCQAQGVIGVDTGLSHLAAALQVPSVTLFLATSPYRTGTVGPLQSNLWLKSSRETEETSMLGSLSRLAVEWIDPQAFTADLAWSKLKDLAKAQRSDKTP